MIFFSLSGFQIYVSKWFQGHKKCITFGSRLEKGKHGIKVFYFTGIAMHLVLNKTAVENYVEYFLFQTFAYHREFLLCVRHLCAGTARVGHVCKVEYFLFQIFFAMKSNFLNVFFSEATPGLPMVAISPIP